MSLHNVVFPVDISFGSMGGPERRTQIVTLANGFEQRNALWSHSRRRYEAGYGVKSLDDIATVTAFFEARQGRLYAFLWRDWADWKSCLPTQTPQATDQFLGTGDGVQTVFPLIKRYVSGDYGWSRDITHPVEGSLLVAQNDQLVPATDYEWTAAGIRFFTPPPVQSRLTAGFCFHVAVRFDIDHLSINLAGFNAGEIPSIPLIEVR